MLIRTPAAVLLKPACVVLLCAVAGCGTTHSTNTPRTATEQLLISDAIDRAVQSIDFKPLEGKSVYFDDRHLYDVVDDAYLISSLRQHMLASGCILKETRDDATFVVEPRAGAVGTDNHDLLFGIPATNVPQLTLLAALPSAIPEIAIAKRRNQRGIAKIAVFAYHRETGQPAWQSGIATEQSTANDMWVLGAGPFERGTIHKGTSFAGGKLTPEWSKKDSGSKKQIVQVTDQAVFDRVVAGESAHTDDADEAIQQVAVQETAPTNPVSSGSAAPGANPEDGPPVLPPPVATASAAAGETVVR